MSRTHHLQIFIGKKYPPYRFVTNPAARKPMTKTEAQLLLKNASKASNYLFFCVVKLIARRGYLALGFVKPHDCLRKYTEISNAYVCRLIQASDTFLQMDPKLLHLKWVSEGAIRPLVHLPEKDLVAIWEWVLEHRDGDSRITSRDMNKAMDALGIKSHENCYGEHQASISVRIDREILPKFRRHIFRIADAIRDSDINTEEEWKIIAKMIYQQILRNYVDPDNNAPTPNKTSRME